MFSLSFRQEYRHSSEIQTLNLAHAHYQTRQKRIKNFSQQSYVLEGSSKKSVSLERGMKSNLTMKDGHPIFLNNNFQIIILRYKVKAFQPLMDSTLFNLCFSAYKGQLGIDSRLIGSSLIGYV